MKWSHYYPLFIEHARLSPRKIVEIGVHRGDGLRWLHKTFPDAELIGIDRDCSLCLNGANGSPWTLIKANTLYLTPQVLERLAGADMIIDDGNHWPYAQGILFKKLFPLMSDQGTYFIEDTQVWRHPLSRLYAKFYGIRTQLTRLIDDMNKWDGWEGETTTRTPVAVLFYPQIVVVKKGITKLKQAECELTFGDIAEILEDK